MSTQSSLGFRFEVFGLLKSWAIPILLCLVGVKLLYNKFHSPVLRRIPGPVAAAYSKYWRVYDVWRGHAHRTAITLHQQHGNLVRTAPNVVSVGDPAEISNIYGLSEKFTKTAFFPIQSISWKKRVEPNLFSERSPAKHREDKRKVANAYSMTSLLASEPAIDSCTALFISQLDSLFVSQKKPVDLGAWLQYYAFDVVGEISFAKKFGFLTQGQDVDGMMEAIEGVLTYSSLCGMVPEWHPRLLGNPLLTRFAPAMESWNQTLVFTLKAINSRTGFKRDPEMADNEEKGLDMLSKWRTVQSSDSSKMSTRDIVVHLSTNVFAGSDTTAIALRAVIYYLCRNPTKKAAMLSELFAADQAGKLSTLISYKETTTHLPYFCAVIKEAMRLHPSVGLIIERHCPPEGATICGQHLPGGTIVGINPWVLNYDAANFSDPNAFLPERWLLEGEGGIAADKAQLTAMENIVAFNFGAGSRSCIGKQISIMELHKVLPQLLRRFEVELTEPGREWKETDHWFVQQEGLICTLTPR